MATVVKVQLYVKIKFSLNLRLSVSIKTNVIRTIYFILLHKLIKLLSLHISYIQFVFTKKTAVLFVNEYLADTKFGRKSYLGPSQPLQWQLAFGLTVQRTIPIDNFQF